MQLHCKTSLRAWHLLLLFPSSPAARFPQVGGEMAAVQGPTAAELNDLEMAASLDHIAKWAGLKDGERDALYTVLGVEDATMVADVAAINDLDFEDSLTNWTVNGNPPSAVLKARARRFKKGAAMAAVPPGLTTDPTTAGPGHQTSDRAGFGTDWLHAV